MERSKAILSIEGNLFGPIDLEVDELAGYTRVRVGPIRLSHELEEWKAWASRLVAALDRLEQGDLPDIHAISGEHPATGGE